jgi:hypothetical protein
VRAAGGRRAALTRLEAQARGLRGPVRLRSSELRDDVACPAAVLRRGTIVSDYCRCRCGCCCSNQEETNIKKAAAVKISSDRGCRRRQWELRGFLLGPSAVAARALRAVVGAIAGWTRVRCAWPDPSTVVSVGFARAGLGLPAHFILLILACDQIECFLLYLTLSSVPAR